MTSTDQQPTNRTRRAVLPSAVLRSVTLASHDILSHRQHIVPASPHARGPGTLQQAGGTSKAGGPTAAACRSSSQLQFVIIIKGLTSEASLPLFTPPSHP